MEKSNLLVILTGKTAAGKDTVMDKILARLPDFKRIVTTTSRKPRPSERDGVDYYFISEADFRHKIKQGDFIEHVEYGGNLYGTQKSEITSNLDQNLIWRIDPSRAGQIRQLVGNLFKKVLVIYLTVGDSVVIKRLKERGLTQKELGKRMNEDAKFWQEFKESYDHVVENVPGKLDETVDKIIKILENHSS